MQPAVHSDFGRWSGFSLNFAVFVSFCLEKMGRSHVEVLNSAPFYISRAEDYSTTLGVALSVVGQVFDCISSSSSSLSLEKMGRSHLRFWFQTIQTQTLPSSGAWTGGLVDTMLFFAKYHFQNLFLSYPFQPVPWVVHRILRVMSVTSVILSVVLERFSRSNVENSCIFLSDSLVYLETGDFRNTVSIGWLKLPGVTTNLHTR